MYSGSSPSRTAWRVATRRAAHQILDAPPVFPDPLALKIVGGDTGNESSDELRMFLAVRSRYAEDELAAAVGRGVTRYVVLGAGLDTFAYRNPYPQLKVVEVDHPATQAWKREQLQRTGIPIPDSLRFAPVDFESQSLTDAGLRTDQVTFFSWLGVVPYLTREAFDNTIRFIAAMPRGSAVAFDYSIPRTAMNALQQIAFDMLAARVARAGEPFQLFFEPSELAEILEKLGLNDRDDLSSQEVYRRYGLKLRGAGHLMRSGSR
jgi:methyltransferase (TIGR00027 family)